MTARTPHRRSSLSRSPGSSVPTPPSSTTQRPAASRPWTRPYALLASAWADDVPGLPMRPRLRGLLQRARLGQLAQLAQRLLLQPADAVGRQLQLARDLVHRALRSTVQAVA